MSSDPTPKGERYAAFISYRHVEPDRPWARWLTRRWRRIGVRPGRSSASRGPRTRRPRVPRRGGGPGLRQPLAEIEAALQRSRYLIVVCSPRTPASQWVDREIAGSAKWAATSGSSRCVHRGRTASRSLRAPRIRGPTDGGRRIGRRGRAGPMEVEPLAADVRSRPGELAFAAQANGAREPRDALPRLPLRNLSAPAGERGGDCKPERGVAAAILAC